MTSTAIYTCYRQLHPPTGVDHAVFGSVTAPNSHDLVVAKASILELYRVHRDASPSSPSGVGGVSPQGDASTGAGAGYFLELVGTFPIAGNITALAVIPVGRSTAPPTQQQQDILVVSFDFAKTALVAYDSTLGRMSTLSIHNFDPDAIGPGSGGVEPSYGLASALKDRPSTIYSCDPAGRCLSAVVAGCLLVVLPTLRHVPPTVFLSEEAKKRVLLPRRHGRRRDPEVQSDNADLEVAGAGVVGRTAAAVEGASRGRFGSDQSEDLTDRSSTGIEGRSKVDDAKGRTNGFVDAIGVGLGADDEDQDGSNGKGLRDDYDGDEEEEEEAWSEGGEAKQDAGGAFAVDNSRASRVRPTVSKPFTLDLEAVDVTGFIKAAVFLEGFHEPALALLYEPIQTCPGRLASMRSTCRLLLLSLNLVQGRAPVIWRVDNLPHDSWDLVAVPAPIGGVQVMSTNAVIHVNDSEVLSILAVNGYARATVEDALLGCPLRASSGDWDWASFRHSRSALEVVDLSLYDVCVELDVMSCAFVTPTSMLFSLKGGEVYALRLHVSPGQGCGVLGASGRVVGQSMRPIGRATPCSVLAVSARGSGGGGKDGDDDSAGPSTGLVFMGSRVGDSLLVDYEVAVCGARSGGRGDSTAAAAAKREPKEEAGGAVRARTGAEGRGGVVGEAPVEAREGARSSGAGGAPGEGCGTSGGAEGVGVFSAGSALPGGASRSLGGGDGNVDDDMSGREESEGRTLARGVADSGKGDSGETQSSAVASAVETETGPSKERGAPEGSADGMEAAADGSSKDSDPRDEESDAERQRKKRFRDEAFREGSGGGSGGQEKKGGVDGGEGGEEANGAAEPPRKGKKLCVSTSETQLAAPEMRAAEPGSDQTTVVSATSDTGGQDDRDELVNNASLPLPGSTRLSDAGTSPAEEKERQQKGAAAATAEHALRGKGNPSTAGVVRDREPSSTTQGPSVSPSPENEVPLEDRETIAEEEELYGAGLGSEPEGGGGGGRELSRLGSRDGERVVEAVGFRLKVVDSLCTLGPIVDAALVPSAYHVPRAAIAPGGASSRSGSWTRGGGGVARGSRGGRTRSPSPLPPPTPPPLEGGTSGGGIRTTLVCAAGYGQQGSLAVFSAGLRTEVVVDLAVPGATGVFAAPEGVIDGGESRGDTLVLVSSSPLTEQRASAGGGGGGSGGGDGDGEADGKGHTRVLAFEDDLRVVELVPESEGNPFVCDAATVDLCAMAGSTIVQAHAQGLRVTRRREFVQEVLAAEDREMDGLGAGPDVTVLRAAAAGAFACCLLSNSHLHLMALEAGEPREADLMPVGDWEEDDSKAGNGGGGSAEGVWTDVEAMCMFGVRETLPPAAENSNATASATSAADLGQSAEPSPGIKAALQTNGVGHQLFLEEAAEEIPDQSEVAAELAADEAGGGEDGFTSEEEWATLYGTGGGERRILGILPSRPCDDSQDASSDGKEPSGAQGFATVGPSAEQTKGWWGGDAWGEDLHSSSGDSACGGCEQTASAYLVVCRKEGALEIHACQGRGKEATTRAVFRASKAVLAPSTLWNELLLVPSPTAPYLSESESDLEALSLTANGEAVSPGGDDAGGGDDRHWSSPTGDDGDGEEEGGRGLGVATGVVAVNGRRLERAATSNGSASSRSVGRETAYHSEPMEVESPRCDTTRTPGANSAPEGGGGDEDDGVVCPAVSDVLVHPVGAVDGPAALRRLILVMHLDNGDLLVYQGRMTSREGASARGGGREQVICFSKLSHDLITRPVKGVPPEAAVPDPSRGRALRGVRSAVGQEGICFARPGCRSALILAERGAVCVTPIAQDDLGDGSGSPPLPPGAPPSWAGVGLGSLAPLNMRDAFPGGGFAAVTAGGGRLRFISAAPASAQLVTPGTSGGGGLGGGGQGHFVAAKIGLGATVHGVLHLPHELAQPGKMGDILKSLLLKRGHYAVLVSKMEDTLAEQPLEEEEQDDGDPADGEDEEVEGPLARHAVKHKNWTVADPALGGAPQLLVHRFELRVLALASGAATAHSPPKGFHRDTEGVDGSTGGDRGREDSRDDDSGSAGRGGIGVDGGGVSVPGEVLSASTVETHPFDADENALCMSLVRLEQGGSPRMYVAVGTGMNDAQGEDKAARGRLILFEVDYAYLAKEDGGHEHAVKLRQVFAKEQLGPIAGESGPVSAVAQLGRHLILSVGKKVIVNRWDPKTRTLELIGFYDPRVYVIGLSVIKNRFVLVGDAYGSVQLVVWREDDHSLTQLSKDHEKCEVFAAEYLVDEPGMGIVVADGRRNLKVLQYAPKAPSSRGGTMLLCQSDFFLGSRVAKLTRRRTRGNLRGGARYCLLAGTLDGGLGAILPVDERIFRRLYALQGIMSNALGHTGSANPRAYRLFDRGPTFRYETKQNMLDGTLLWRFVGLDARTQNDLTRAIGTTTERVMSNLLDIDLASLF